MRSGCAIQINAGRVVGGAVCARVSVQDSEVGGSRGRETERGKEIERDAETEKQSNKEIATCWNIRVWM